jgi:[FeFe] hydrogenase H-cluster maturation GTPase HydF
MNETPSANRVHIAFFGRRNAGKSSLVNAVTGQNLAVVSEIKGTTTDPVHKAMELLPLGPVVIIDTPGIDDEGDLGEKRVGKARQVLNKTDVAVLVLDGELSGELPGGLLPAEKELLDVFISRNIPYITVLNKSDIAGAAPGDGIFPVSAKTGENINLLKEKIAALALGKEPEQKLVADLIKPNDFIILVIPIDKAAPKGRLILPQQQMIRDILEAGANAISVRECELQQTLADVGKKPSLVITDSQAFALVSSIVPQDIPLTSFSILFARYKGFWETSVKGAAALDSLQDGDKILVCEGCTHHRQCDDIGTIKLPRMIKNHSKKEPEFRFCSGGDFPQDLSDYKVVIHCGACMLNEREMHYRRRHSEKQNIPFTNYGIAMAHIHGILERSITMLASNMLDIENV